MLTVLGWILVIFPGILFVGQLISSLNFSFAQKIGLQENPAHADPLVQRAERYVAYWDLVTLGWLPLSGILMLLDHSAWPLMGFFGSAIYIDTAGREAAKNLSLKHHGLQVGAPGQHRFFFATYIIMLILGLLTLAVSLAAIAETCCT